MSVKEAPARLPAKWSVAGSWRVWLVGVLGLVVPLSACVDSPTESEVPQAAVNTSKPGQVTDLAAASVSDTSVTLKWTQVNDGSGRPASYQIRYTLSPIKWNWGSATVATSSDCANPVVGTAIGASIQCTVVGLSPSTAYDFQLVSFRERRGKRTYGALSNVATATTAASPSSPLPPSPTSTNECASPRAGWIWCDDFEQDRLASYFEYSSAGGNFARTASVGVDGSYGMRGHFDAGQVEAGNLKIAFGETPSAYFRAVDAGTSQYREVYWRLYVKHAANWSGGGGDKLSRATVLASSNWAQAMIAHVWSGNGGSTHKDYLLLDPASGTDAAGNLITTTYNDFANLRWLGAVAGSTPLFDASHVGRWYCVEAHARLNDAGQTNGVFEMWIDGSLDARITGLNWLGSYSTYGINAVFFENYWNAGSPQAQDRYFDRIVVSTERIGC